MGSMGIKSQWELGLRTPHCIWATLSLDKLCVLDVEDCIYKMSDDLSTPWLSYMYD